MPIKRKKGFTLIEVLVSITIMLIVTLGLTGMQSSFGKSVTSRKLSTILNDVANNQISRCKTGNPLEPSADYVFDNNKKITVYTKITNGTCAIPASVNTCENITIVTSNSNISNLSGSSLSNMLNKSRAVTLQSTICKFN